MADDYSADRFTTGAVEVGGSTIGTIETAYDEDWFAVELVAGRTYQFDLTGSPGGGGTLPDTYFRAIYNSEGRYQSGTYNDNFEGSRDSRVTFTPTVSGTYYARVSGDRDEIGDYTLSVRDMTPPEAGNPTPAEEGTPAHRNQPGSGYGSERFGGRHGPAQRQLHPRPGRGRGLGHGHYRDRLRPGPVRGRAGGGAHLPV